MEDLESLVAQPAHRVWNAVLDKVEAHVEVKAWEGRRGFDGGAHSRTEQVAVNEDLEERSFRFDGDGVWIRHTAVPEVGRRVPLLASAAVDHVGDGIDEREAAGVEAADVVERKTGFRNAKLEERVDAALEGSAKGLGIVMGEEGPVAHLTYCCGYEEVGVWSEEDAGRGSRETENSIG